MKISIRKSSRIQFSVNLLSLNFRLLYIYIKLSVSRFDLLEYLLYWYDMICNVAKRECKKRVSKKAIWIFVVVVVCCLCVCGVHCGKPEQICSLCSLHWNVMWCSYTDTTASNVCTYRLRTWNGSIRSDRNELNRSWHNTTYPKKSIVRICSHYSGYLSFSVMISVVVLCAIKTIRIEIATFANDIKSH